MQRQSITRICPTCQRPFYVSPSRINPNAPTCCSHACAQAQRPDLPTRFWAKVVCSKDDGCWLWTAARYPEGYGAVRCRGRARQAHRIAWELTYGPIPTGLYVCHRCDVRLCVRPSHLFLGTARENIQDASHKGRMPGGQAYGDRNGSRRYPERRPRGSAVYNSRLSPTDVQAIRARLGAGATQGGLAREYGVTKQSIYAIAHGKNWRHLL